MPFEPLRDNSSRTPAELLSRIAASRSGSPNANANATATATATATAASKGTPVQHIYLSRAAHDYFVEQAVNVYGRQPVRDRTELDFLSRTTYLETPTHRRSRFLSRYINELVAANPTPQSWLDTRPDDLLSEDLPRLQRGELPLWNSFEPRLEYGLRLLPTTVSRLYVVAQSFGIDRYDLRGSQEIAHTYEHSPLTFAGYTLEAIGSRYLTPRQPLAPHAAQ